MFDDDDRTDDPPADDDDQGDLEDDDQDDDAAGDDDDDQADPPAPRRRARSAAGAAVTDAVDDLADQVPSWARELGEKVDHLLDTFDVMDTNEGDTNGRRRHRDTDDGNPGQGDPPPAPGRKTGAIW